jgi:dolichol-phosphate mannosyltransferase
VNRQTKLRTKPLELTLVVPTLNERGNLEKLLERIEKAMLGIHWELIFVDDSSSDGTPEAIQEIAQLDPRIRLIRRFRRRGLASAVIEGALASTTPVIAVLDADLQHDETILPSLVRPLLLGATDLAVGTRYVEGSSTENWDRKRLRISRTATWMAAGLLKTRCSDPMSGLFAVRRDTLLAVLPHLSTVGYKILFDILASSPKNLKITEVPYRFGVRHAGASKLDHAVELEYVELLLDKLVGRWIPPRLLMFGMVGGLGVLVHLIVLDLFFRILGTSFPMSQTIAVVGAMTFNFALNNVFTYRDRQLKGLMWWRGLLSFYLVCSIGAVANVGIGSLVFRDFSTWWLAGIAGAIVGSVWNYVASSWLTWTRR